MRIILVSCFLLSTCSLALATEYVEGVYNPQPSKKDKRFIFNKSTNIQRLIQGLTAFSSISNSNSNKNIPLTPPAKSAPAPSTTPLPAPAPAPASVGVGVTLAIPGSRTTTAAPAKNNDFDNELEYLTQTQYRDNAYALPETAPSSGQITQPKFDRLPPLNQNTTNSSLPSPQVYSQSISLSGSPQQYTSAGLSFGAIDTAAPLTYSHSQIYSQPLPYLSAHQTQLSLVPESTQTYLPQQHVIPAPQISPLTYQTQHETSLSYASPVQASVPLNAYNNLYQSHASIPLTSYDNQYQLKASIPLTSYDNQYQLKASIPLTSYDSHYQLKASIPLTSYNQYQLKASIPLTSYDNQYQQKTSIPETTYSNHYQSHASIPSTSYDNQYQLKASIPLTSYDNHYQLKASIPSTSYDNQYQQKTSIPETTYSNHYQTQASIPLATYSNHYQSLSNNHFSFSNQLRNSAHSQTAYFGNALNTGERCACKDDKK